MRTPQFEGFFFFVKTKIEFSEEYIHSKTLMI